TALAEPNDNWRERLSPMTPGAFPPLRPMTLNYRFGWSGIGAGEAEIRYKRPKPDVLELDATGGTTGLVRTLWKMDATHAATAYASTLHPIAVKQTEAYRSYTMKTDLQFTSRDVTRLRQKTPDNAPAKPKRFTFPNVMDLHCALLFVRGQRLE